jgi:hypothetical protein
MSRDKGACKSFSSVSSTQVPPCAKQASHLPTLLNLSPQRTGLGSCTHLHGDSWLGDCAQQQGELLQVTGLQTRVGQEGWQHPEDWQEGTRHTAGLQLKGKPQATWNLTGMNTAGPQLAGTQQEDWLGMDTEQAGWQGLDTQQEAWLGMDTQ